MESSNKLRCPRCHHFNDKSNEFCDYCGFNLADYFANDDENNPKITSDDFYALTKSQSRQQKFNNKPASNAEQHNPKKHARINLRTLKHPKRWSVAVAAIVLLIGGYSYGQSYYSKSNTLNRLASAVPNGDLDYYFISNGRQSDNAKMIANYFKANPSATDRLKEQLSANGQTKDGLIKYQKTGTRFGIFPKYQAVIDSTKLAQQTYSVKVKTKPYALILLNDKVLGHADSNGNYEATDLTGQQSMIGAKYHENGRAITTNQIKVTSADNKHTVTLIQQTRTKPRSFDQNQAQAVLDSTYKAVQDVNNHAKAEPALSTFFVDGKNNHYYQSVNKLALIFHQDDIKTNYQAKITSFSKYGKDNYRVKYNLTYHFDDGKRIHIQIFKSVAVINKDNKDNYKLASVISDAEPIKNEYHKK